ncbi:hypothetical protein [Bacillus cereus]|nr:hypothetical protein [Bacillus cereus]
MLAIQKQNQKVISKKKPLFDLQDVDEYLHSLVKSKSIFSLSILVLISIAVVYIPYGATLKLWLKDVPILLKSIIKALVYTGPIVVVFCYVFKDAMKQLFQKMSFRQHMICVIVAIVLILFGLYWVLFLNSLISINPATNVMNKKSEQEILLNIPGVFIQLLGENIMFISFLLFWYKCMKYIKISNKMIVITSILLAGITFGMMHLTAYQFNVLQCVLIIGIPATTHLLLFAKYRNVHMAYWLHVYYDLILILWGVLG